MPEIPRDPLAEHPLAPDPARGRSGPRTTLDLFPNVSEAPYGPPESPVAQPVSAAAEPREAVRERTEQAPPPFREPELAGADLEGPRAVAFARRVAAGQAWEALSALGTPAHLR